MKSLEKVLVGVEIVRDPISGDIFALDLTQEKIIDIQPAWHYVSPIIPGLRNKS